jgi:hypothetical protein
MTEMADPELSFWGSFALPSHPLPLKRGSGGPPRKNFEIFHCRTGEL